MIDTLEKNVVRGVPVVRQRQQLSTEILTNLSIKTSTWRDCKSAVVFVLKQKATSTSRYILLSSNVSFETMVRGIRYKYVLSNRV